MKELSRQQILESFSIEDRLVVDPPGLTGVEWQDLDFFSWKDPDGRRGYIVAPWRDRLVGLVLRFSGSAQGARSGMCNLCLGIPPDGGTTMVMIDTWYHPRTSHGLHICRDLSCNQAVRGMKRLDAMRETITTGQKIERFQKNLDRFIASLAEQP